MIKPLTPSDKQGIAWMLLHCFLFSAMAVGARLLAHNFTMVQIVFGYNSIAFIAIVSYALRSQSFKEILVTSKMSWHGVRAVLSVVSMLCYFHALTLIKLTDVQAIVLLSPFVSTIVAVLFFKEALTWIKLVGLCGGAIGAWLILQPTSPAFEEATLFVVVAVFMWSMVNVTIKELGKSESTTTQLAYVTGLSALMTFPFAIGQDAYPTLGFSWVILLAIGIMYMIRSIALFKAFQHAEISLLMVFDVSVLVFSAVLAWLFFDEIMSKNTLLGALVIMVSHGFFFAATSRSAKNHIGTG